METIQLTLYLELTVLSILLAIVGSSFAISLAKFFNLKKNRQYFWLVCSGLLFGLSLWILHFTGVLYSNDNVDIALLAFIVVMIVVTVLVFRAHKKKEARKLDFNKLNFRLLTESLSDIVVLYNTNGEALYASPACETILGYTQEEYIRTPLLKMVHMDDLQTILENRNKALSGEQTRYVVRAISKHGKQIWMETIIKPMLDEKGEVTQILATSRNIHQQKVYQDLLEESEERYRKLVELSPEPILVHINGEIVFANAATIKALHATSDDQVIGKNVLQFVHPDYRPFVIDRMKQMSQFGNTIDLSEEKMIRVDGTIAYAEIAGIGITYNGKPAAQLIMRDVSVRKKYEGQLKEMAYYDVLTGIPNRRLFYDRLSNEIHNANLKNSKLAIMYLDCDRFKRVNDSYGHYTGDQLLIQFVKEIQGCLRESDTIARLGGDEFAIILSDYITSINDVAEIAQRIIELVQDPWIINDHAILVTSSIGISIYPDNATELDELLACADQALYRAKEKGRNQFQFFTEDLSNNIVRQLQLEEGLRNAMNHGNFHLVYQPQMDIQKNTMVGAEVLLRFTHPELGPISPIEFIPIIERVGIMDEVTEWIMREALKQQKEWLDIGYPKINLAINISPRTLENVTFLQMVQDCMKVYGTDPKTIEFELTEDTLIENLESASTILMQVKNLGVKISLDDFGAGYASLKYFTELPFDKLKLDRSFVQRAVNNKKDKAIIASILELSQRLHFEVICEGVETKEQLSYLLNKGYHLVQGYYFSKPLTSDEFEDFYSKHQS